MIRQLALAGCAVCLLACDGTLSELHSTRGRVPAVYPDPPREDAAATEPDGPAFIRAAHLVVMHKDSRNAPPTMVRPKREARARAEEALSKLKAGADFGEIAALYSDEPGAAERKGDLGQFSRKQMVRKFSSAAFKLKPGELSDIVETEFGFHVILRTE